MYDVNPGEIDFGSSYREVRVSEGSSYRESTVCGREEKALKNQCLQNLNRDIPVRTQCDKDGA